MKRTLSALFCFALGACRCGDEGLGNALSDVHVVPDALSFGNVYLQAAPSQRFQILNTGAAPEDVTVALWADAGSPFVLSEATLSVGIGESVPVPVTFTPADAGSSTAVVEVVWREGTTQVQLSGTGIDWPPCMPSGPCATAAFVPDAGSCVQSPIADGAACDGGDPCLVDTACANGQCLGKLNLCDDGDRCTTDYCVAGQGCQHQDNSAMCDGTDPCQVYRCDPSSGCASSQAPNGTPCSSEESCQTANVCFEGQCIGVPAPNGVPCALWWAPCVDDATCQGGACDSPTADAYQPGQLLWQRDAGFALFSFAVDDGGTSYFETYDPDAGNEIAAIDSCGREHWRTPGNGTTMLLGSSVWAVGLESVEQFDRATGTPLWSETFENPFDAGLLEVNAMAAPRSAGIVLSGFEPWDYNGNSNLLLSLLPSGSFGWVDASATFSQAPNSVLADSSGNLYYASGLICPETSCTSNVPGGSVDASGNPRYHFGAAGMLFTPLAVGSDFVLAATGLDFRDDQNEITAFGFDGSVLYDSPLPLYTADWLFGYGSNALIDSSGTSYVLGSPTTGGWTLEALTRAGVLAWSVALSDPFAVASPALGDQGTLFVVTQSAQGEISLRAFDTGSGNALWTADLGPNPISSDGNPNALALSPSSELILLSQSEGVAAYFAGKHRPPQGAPWPRQGGDNSNRNAVP